MIKPSSPDRKRDHEVTRRIHSRITTDPRVILLIPTVEGRDFLADTLASVLEHAHCFDQLLLSVNGTTHQNADQILHEQELASRVNIKVFCTRRHLSAVQHSRFINKKLPAHAHDQDCIFLLADDDLLPAGANIKNYIQAIKNAHGTAVGMGRFATFEESKPIPFAQPQHIEPGESISPLEFLVRNQQGHRMTNISSMIVPYGIFKEASSFMWHLGSSGRRTEYILSTHRRVNLLYSPPSSSVLIRQHLGQEGRILSFESLLHDELVYISWIWIHQRAMRPWAQTVGQDFKTSRFRSLLLDLLKRRLKITTHRLFKFAMKIKLLCRHHL